jgi:hypothetical protein
MRGVAMSARFQLSPRADRRVLRKVAAGALSVAALGVPFLVSVPAAYAGQPVDPSTLNPPPPSFEACRTTGDGVICQGSTSYDPYGPDWTPLQCGTGVAAFNIYDASDGPLRQVATRHYDKDLNMTTRDVHFETFGEVSNPLAGTAVRYHAANLTKDVVATPGDLTSTTESQIGSMIFTLPHQGAVTVNAGRVTYDFNGNIEFASAKDPYAFNLGDMSALQNLCAVLAG